MHLGDYISFGTLVLSIVAITLSILSIISKKYELTGIQRSQLLAWHKDTVEILIILKLSICQKCEISKIEYLSKLSALIENGRFYFPNIKKKNTFGNEKPSAYKGYRDITLDFLIFSYDILKREDCDKYINHLENLQRLFTSRVFDVLSPQKYNRLVAKHTMISMKKGISLPDYLKSDPKNYVFYK